MGRLSDVSKLTPAAGAVCGLFQAKSLIEARGEGQMMLARLF
jgi:hypothetical protein